MPALLSAHYGIEPDVLDRLGAFDCFVDLDSRLHVDPHLLEASAEPEMVSAHTALKTFFSETVRLLDACSSADGPIWDAVVKRLRRPEVKGVSLGFSRANGDGSGIGPELASAIATNAYAIVKAGYKDSVVFEVVSLFTEDFGADRISDLTISVAQSHFAEFTERVAKEAGIPTEPVLIAGVNRQMPVFQHKGKALPRYLVPKDVLRELPVVLCREDIAAAAEYNATVRKGVNELFASAGLEARKATKGDIWGRIAANPKLAESLMDAYLRAGGSPYDFSLDPGAEFKRFLEAQQLAEKHPLSLVKPTDGEWSPALAQQTVLAICEHFKKLVETHGLWDAFWVHKAGKSRQMSERAIQRIFLSIALTYCNAGGHDLDISAEPNAGKGPVDFKFSRGAKVKVTVELKKSSHKRVLHGYQTQLRLYNEAESTSNSVYLIVRLTDLVTNINAVRASQAAAKKRGERVPDVVVVDGRVQKSASTAE